MPLSAGEWFHEVTGPRLAGEPVVSMPLSAGEWFHAAFAAKMTGAEKGFQCP